MISDLSNGGENNVVDRTVTQNCKKNKTEVVINCNYLFLFLKEVSLSISDKMVNLCTGLVTSLEQQS